MITEDRLKEVLSYEPDTGLFRWLIALNKKFKNKIGTVAGSYDAKGYIVIGIDGKLYKAHRLAFLYMTGKFPELDGEHKDTIKDNNKWSNLRNADDQQNQFNISYRKNNKLAIKGVHQRGDKFIAQININGTVMHLGIFDLEQDAEKTYINKAREIHGEFLHNSLKDAEGRNI